MSGHAIDLSQHSFTRSQGDVTVIGTWLLADNPDDVEPALVLVPTYRMRKGAMKPCCIGLSSAYRYDEPGYLLRAAMRFNEALGFTDSMTHVNKLAELIHGSLQDLIEMPPKPVHGSRVLGEAIITDASGRKMSQEIREDV